ncbi:MAG: 8-amino-7-oxononanoate synthase [Polyangiaceae bacterium]|nr:8-amino-7-oxononanoate synthase [Polyangiaceae bacterium]MCW5790070.1 8-amino-7-oxononanoate synthase [Polyangiaceae bacterium]
MSLAFLADRLAQLQAANLKRTPDQMPPAGLDCASNDYLGYAREALESWGAGASRSIFGTHPTHLALEQALASWVGLEGALLFSSGYAANVGVLQALALPGELILSDALNHASVIDGCRLSRAEVCVLPHLDLEALEQALSTTPGRRAWFVTESYFSMDGDGPDLKALAAVIQRHPHAAWIVDEAHALGVYGVSGAGRCAASGVRPDVLVGTLGKALGSSGAFVAGEGVLRDWLWNKARSFVFSTATSPAQAHATRALLERCQRDDEARGALKRAATWLHAELWEAGLPFPRGYLTGPIFPIVCGSSEAALSAASKLASHGFVARAIRPPTVPPGTARLRITLRPSISMEALSQLASLLIDAWRQSQCVPEGWVRL